MKELDWLLANVSVIKQIFKRIRKYHWLCEIHKPCIYVLKTSIFLTQLNKKHFQRLILWVDISVIHTTHPKPVSGNKIFQTKSCISLTTFYTKPYCCWRVCYSSINKLYFVTSKVCFLYTNRSINFEQKGLMPLSTEIWKSQPTSTTTLIYTQKAQVTIASLEDLFCNKRMTCS